MRKTSKDGGDSTSVTSGYESESKRTSVGIIKTKRDSIKRKVQNFSHESDDTVIEPLLQIDKNETMNRSAKYLLSKSKTESISEKESDVYSDNKSEIKMCKSNSSAGTSCNISKTLHNYMNINVCGAQDGSKVVSTGNSPLLVDIKGCGVAVRSNQSSSIFTTAKINADSSTKSMEPIQVTPVPILSTIEGNVFKAGISHEFQQNKSFILSPSNDILKTAGIQDGKDQIPSIQQVVTSYSVQSASGKSDLNKASIADTVSKFNDVKESRLSKITTESETIFIDKTCDKSFPNISAASTLNAKDSGMLNKIPQIQSQTNTSITVDQKYKSVYQQPKCTDLKNSINTQNKGLEEKTANETGNSLQESDLSSLKSITNKEKNVACKSISSTSSSIKYLQRQKHTILDDNSIDSINLNTSAQKSLEKSVAVGSYQTSKSDKDGLTATDTKDVRSSVKSQSDQPLGSLKSASVSDKFITSQISKPIKESSLQSSISTKGIGSQSNALHYTQSTGSLKSDSIKASSGSVIATFSKNLNIASPPKEISTTNTITGSSTDIKKTKTSEIHKSVKSQNKSIVTPTVTSTNTVLSASTISVAKGEAKSKPLITETGIKSAVVVTTVDSTKTCTGKSITSTTLITTSTATDTKSSGSKSTVVVSTVESIKTCSTTTTCSATVGIPSSIKSTVGISTVGSSKPCTGKSNNSTALATTSTATVTKSSGFKSAVVVSTIDSVKTCTTSTTTSSTSIITVPSSVKSVGVVSSKICTGKSISSTAAAIAKSSGSKSAVVISTVDTKKNCAITTTSSSTGAVGKSASTKSAEIVSTVDSSKICIDKLVSSTLTTSSTETVGKSSSAKSTAVVSTIDSSNTSTSKSNVTKKPISISTVTVAKSSSTSQTSSKNNILDKHRKKI